MSKPNFKRMFLVSEEKFNTLSKISSNYKPLETPSNSSNTSVFKSCLCSPSDSKAKPITKTNSTDLNKDAVDWNETKNENSSATVSANLPKVSIITGEKVPFRKIYTRKYLHKNDSQSHQNCVHKKLKERNTRKKNSKFIWKKRKTNDSESFKNKQSKWLKLS